MLKKPPLITDLSEEDSEDEHEPARKHLVGVFAVLLATTLHRIDDLTGRLADGMDVEAWAKEFRDELTAAHSEAWKIGRQLGGDAKAIHAGDIQAGEDAWARQEEFFKDFLADIHADRYTQDGSLNEKGFGNRARSYGQSVRNTVHEGFVDSMGDDPLDWNLGDAVHCGPNQDFPYDCPSLAEMSPLPASEWPTRPVGCDCECLFNCKCFLSSPDDKYSTQGI